MAFPLTPSVFVWATPLASKVSLLILRNILRIRTFSPLAGIEISAAS